MSLDRVAAVKAEREVAVGLLHQLTPAEWEAPSRCAGWSVKDVVSHMGAAAHGTFTTWVVGMMTTKDIEGNNDKDVEKRRGWEPARVLAEYEKWSKRFGAAQVLLQKPAMRSLPIRVGEVGTYPAKLLTSAIVFDSGLHVRYDIATAVGRDLGPRAANSLAVTLEWMLAGMPVMTGSALDWLTSSVELNLVGPGGGTWTVTPGGDGGRVTVTEGGAPAAAASIEGDATGFPLWGTRRSAWRECDLSLKGDEDVATRFLDSMRII